MGQLIYYSATGAMLAVTGLFPIIGIRATIYLQLVFLPFTNPYVAGMSLFFSWAIALYMSIGRGKRKLYFPKALTLISAFWICTSLLSFYSNGISERGLFQWAEFVLYGLMAFFLCNASKIERLEIRKLVKSLTLGGMLVAPFLIHVKNTYSHPWPTYAILGPNEGSFYLVLTGILLPLLLIPTSSRSGKLFWWLCIAFSIYSAHELESRASLAVGIAIVSSYFPLCLVKRKTHLAIAAAVFCCLTLLSYNRVLDYIDTNMGNTLDFDTNFSNNERLAMLELSYEHMIDKPLLGWGWGTVDQIFTHTIRTKGVYPHPHSSYARFGVELGVSGVLILIVLYVSIAFYSLKQLSHNRFVAFRFMLNLSAVLAISSLVEVIFYGASRGVIASIMIGLSFSLCESLKQSNSGTLKPSEATKQSNLFDEATDTRSVSQNA
jgi:O-antigen ligase